MQDMWWIAATNHMINHLNDIILFATFIAILWYTIETRMLRKATIQSTELGNRPLLTLYHKYDMAGSILKVANIGRGHALGIRCFYQSKDNKSDSLDRLNAYLDMLESNSSKIFNNAFRDANQGLVQLLPSNICPNFSENIATIILEYTDILGNKYRTECLFDTKSLSIKKVMKI